MSQLLSEIENEDIGEDKSPKKLLRKPYTVTKMREKWTQQEHQKFLDGIELHGRQWKKIEDYIGTKTAIQIRSHAQKYFSKLEKQYEKNSNGGMNPNIPPPRPKRKPAHPYPRKQNEEDDTTSQNQYETAPETLSTKKARLEGSLTHHRSQNNYPDQDQGDDENMEEEEEQSEGDQLLEGEVNNVKDGIPESSHLNKPVVGQQNPHNMGLVGQPLAGPQTAIQGLQSGVLPSNIPADPQTLMSFPPQQPFHNALSERPPQGQHLHSSQQLPQHQPPFHLQAKPGFDPLQQRGSQNEPVNPYQMHQMELNYQREQQNKTQQQLQERLFTHNDPSMYQRNSLQVNNIPSQHITSVPPNANYHPYGLEQQHGPPTDHQSYLQHLQSAGQNDSHAKYKPTKPQNLHQSNLQGDNRGPENIINQNSRGKSKSKMDTDSPQDIKGIQMRDQKGGQDSQQSQCTEEKVVYSVCAMACAAASAAAQAVISQAGDHIQSQIQELYRKGGLRNTIDLAPQALEQSLKSIQRQQNELFHAGHNKLNNSSRQTTNGNFKSPFQKIDSKTQNQPINNRASDNVTPHGSGYQAQVDRNNNTPTQQGQDGMRPQFSFVQTSGTADSGYQKIVGNSKLQSKHLGQIEELQREKRMSTTNNDGQMVQECANSGLNKQDERIYMSSAFVPYSQNPNLENRVSKYSNNKGQISSQDRLSCKLQQQIEMMQSQRIQDPQLSVEQQESEQLESCILNAKSVFEHLQRVTNQYIRDDAKQVKEAEQKQDMLKGQQNEADKCKQELLEIYMKQQQLQNSNQGRGSADNQELQLKKQKLGEKLLSLQQESKLSEYSGQQKLNPQLNMIGEPSNSHQLKSDKPNQQMHMAKQQLLLQHNVSLNETESLAHNRSTKSSNTILDTKNSNYLLNSIINQRNLEYQNVLAYNQQSQVLGKPVGNVGGPGGNVNYVNTNNTDQGRMIQGFYPGYTSNQQQFSSQYVVTPNPVIYHGQSAQKGNDMFNNMG